MLAAGALHAQAPDIGVHALLTTHTEVSEQRRARGVGAGATAEFALGHMRVAAGIERAWLDTGADTLGTFDLTTVDVRVGWALTPWLIVESGGGRRSAAPVELAEDYGFIRTGLRFETPLAAISTMWVRGGLLPAVRFNGGGQTGVAVEVGFGLTVGSPTSRLGGRIEYDMQRVGRTVTGLDAPVLLETARVGVVVRPF
jgi:hypothetical protein